MMLIVFTGMKLIIELIFQLLYQSTDSLLYYYVLMVLRIIRFESMAIGGLAAYLIYRNHPLLNLIFHPVAQILSAVGFFIIIVGDMPPIAGVDIAVSLVFVVVILNVAAAPRCIYRFETPLLRKLGDLSYAMYMGHAPILWVLYAVGVKGIAFQSAGVVLTLVAAYLLHRYLELPIMRLRDRVNASPILPAVAAPQSPG